MTRFCSKKKLRTNRNQSNRNPPIYFVSFNVSNSKRNWAKFGVGVKLIVILRHIIAYFSINIWWHSQNVSFDSRKWLIKHLFPLSSCKKQINKHNSYLLLAFLQSGSVPELDMHESKHFFRGQFVHSELLLSVKWRHMLSFEIKTGAIYGMETNIKSEKGWF
jgi:hypothetical protein